MRFFVSYVNLRFADISLMSSVMPIVLDAFLTWPGMIALPKYAPRFNVMTLR